MKYSIPLCAVGAIVLAACSGAPGATETSPEPSADAAEPVAKAATTETDAAAPGRPSDLLPPVAVPGEGHDLSGLQLAAPGTDWNLAVQGGWGGYGGPTLRGAVIYAMQADSGAYIDRLALAYYIPSNPDNQYRNGDFYGTLGPIGGTGGNYNAWSYCPPNMGVIGIQGHSNVYLDSMGLICSNATTPINYGTGVWTGPVFGGNGGNYYYDDCGNGGLMVGVNLQDNVYIDHIQGVCSRAH